MALGTGQDASGLGWAGVSGDWNLEMGTYPGHGGPSGLFSHMETLRPRKGVRAIPSAPGTMEPALNRPPNPGSLASGYGWAKGV